MLVESKLKKHLHTLATSLPCGFKSHRATGVQEYCNFFKSIEDAKALRRRVSECFERAALPAVSGQAPAFGGGGVKHLVLSVYGRLGGRRRALGARSAARSEGHPLVPSF